MDFVLLFGPPAVGKMTIGYELAARTGLKMMHNHMTIDLVLNFFPYGSEPFGRLVSQFRRRIMEEVAASDLPGMIFTYVWALDEPGDKADVDAMCQIFRDQGGKCWFVELAASQTTRLERNRTPFRLEQKVSKRDLERSERNLIDLDQRYKMNSDGTFFYPESYLKLETDGLSAAESAERIIAHFGFKQI